MAATGLRSVVPGVALLGVIAVTAHALAGYLPRINALVVAVGLGALLGNLAPVPDVLEPGIDRHKLLLETGIVLLGASVSAGQIADSGPAVLVLVVGVVAFGITFVELLSRRLPGVSSQSGALLAAGASICGVSAVAAVARGVDADRETLAYAAAAVLALDAVTLVVFPVAGGVLNLSDRVFGVWAGLSMFSTGPVAAAGFAHSPVAGRWATLTKLARNALLGVVATGYAIAHARDGEDGGFDIGIGDVWRKFPKFLVGFVVVAVVANTGLLSSADVAAVEAAADWLFAVAFAGVGFSIRVETVRATGLAPVAVLVAHLLVVGTVALAATVLLV